MLGCRERHQHETEALGPKYGGLYHSTIASTDISEWPDAMSDIS